MLMYLLQVQKMGRQVMDYSYKPFRGPGKPDLFYAEAGVGTEAEAAPVTSTA